MPVSCPSVGTFSGSFFVNPPADTLGMLAGVGSPPSQTFIAGDVTGNARGANSIDVQLRSSPTKVVSGVGGIAFGRDNTVANNSVAVGVSNSCNGTGLAAFDVAIGQQNLVNDGAGGSDNTAIGGGNQIVGSGASGNVAIGQINVLTVGVGGGSFAAGISNTVSGGVTACITVGVSNTASATGATCYGFLNVVGAVDAVAIGQVNTIGAAGVASMLIGQGLGQVAAFATPDRVRVGTGPTNNVNIGGAGTHSSFIDFDSVTGNVIIVPDATAHSVTVLPNSTVAQLPAAGAANKGAVTNVSDSNVVAAGNFGAVVAGGGANFVPVYSDGANWRIG